MNTQLQIRPHTRLHSVRMKMKQSLRDGAVVDCVLPLTKGEARLLMQIIDNELAKTEANQAAPKD